MRAAHLSDPADRMAMGPAGAVPVADGDALVLVAHGSRDPRAAEATVALARAVSAARPGQTVRVSYLDHTEPRPEAVLHELADTGHRRVTLVPLLLTAAFHRRVDMPAVVAAARAEGVALPLRTADVLGPVDGVVDELLVAGLRRRLAESDPARPADPARPGDFPPVGSRCPFDAVVLAAAGTRDAAARRTVEEVAGALGTALGMPSLAGYASAAGPTVDEAVGHLRAAGARRIGVAAYFLAPGRLYTVAVTAARAAGAIAVATPLRDAPELARLVLARAGR